MSTPTKKDWAAVRLLVLDFDGVMTDNRVLVDENGCESVWCHRGDGYGVGLLKKAGVEVMVLSTEPNPVVAARCRKLKVPCIHDCPDKLQALKQVAEKRGLASADIAFVGNDINDLEGLRWVGLPVAVADAVPEVLQVARFVTRRDGGYGAVREVADHIIRSR